MKAMVLFAKLKHRRVLLLGSSRSGTTWLSEVINYDNRYRYIFEPVRHKHTIKNKLFKEIPYVPSAPMGAKYHSYFTQLFNGKIHNFWTDSWSPTRYSRSLLIKEVRINFLLNWLSHSYPDIKLIFLIRNPYAVVASRLNTNGGWEEYFVRERAIVNKKKLLSDKQRQLINRRNLAPAEQFFLGWCIENIIPLQQLPADSQVKIVFYEDLVLHPQAVLADLFNYLGYKPSPDLWQIVKNPSKTSSKKRGSKRPQYIKSWQRQISPAAIKKLRSHAKVFGVDKLYPDGFMPDKAAFNRL